jgi:hypothetical protein
MVFCARFVNSAGDSFMRSWLAAFLAIGSVALGDASLWAQRSGPGRGDWEATRNGWLFSLEEGNAQARKSDKPLMVVLRCVP